MAGRADIFAKYPNPVFVETGTFLGDGIAAALDAGFEDIRSIELDRELYRRARIRFKGDSRVWLYYGDSARMLAKVIGGIRTRITFWLDAHYSGGITARGRKNPPLAEEFAVIAAHPVSGHTILVDDVRCFGTDIFEGYTNDAAIEAIRAICPDYQISYEDGTVPDDILVATL